MPLDLELRFFPPRFAPASIYLDRENMHMPFRSLGVTAVLFFIMATSLSGFAEDDWPRFRGKRLDNVSPDKGLLKEWPQGGPPVVWKATGVGSGYSSVAIAGGKVFTMGNKGDSVYLVAVDQSNGTLLWSTKVGRAGGNLGCTPTVDGDYVYGMGEDSDLACVETGTGKLVWQKNLQQEFDGDFGSWKYTESPLIDGAKLICTPGGRKNTIVALNKLTGELIWKCAVPFEETKAGYSSIVPASIGGLRQYVQLLSGGVVGIGANDGTVLWKYDRLGHNTANVPTPIVLGDQVFCSAGYGKGGALLQLTTVDDGTTAKEVYFNPQLTNKHGGLVAVDGYVYGDHDDSGRPFCAEVKTGKVVWRKAQSGPGTGSACVTYADGHLYIRFDNGVMALVPATPKEYKEVSTFRIPNAESQSWSHPVVVGGKLYLRENDIIWCYDVKQH
jgi:outer membrane protein assembly factor BamB